MSIFEEPSKARNILVATIIGGSLLLLATAGALGYVCYRAYGDIEELQSDNATLEKQVANLEDDLDEQLEAQLGGEEEYQERITELEAEVKTLKSQSKEKDSEIEALKAEKASLEASVANFNARIVKIKAYNDVHDYIYQVIMAHNGFTGWTEAEYQVGRSLALATGDSGLVAVVDAAWNQHDGDPVARFAAVMKAIIDGIAANA